MTAARAAMLLLLGLALVLAPAAARAEDDIRVEDEEPAVKVEETADEVDDALPGSLILRKTIETDFPGSLAENREFTVKLEVHNAGKGDAYEVKVVDNWSAESFRIVSGEKEATWDSIAAGETKTHELTVVPTAAGDVAGFRATIEYKPTPKSKGQAGFSTPMPTHRVYEEALYAKLTNKFYFEWAVFGGGMALFVLLPLLLHNNAKAAMPGKDKSA